MTRRLARAVEDDPALAWYVAAGAIDMDLISVRLDTGATLEQLVWRQDGATAAILDLYDPLNTFALVVIDPQAPLPPTAVLWSLHRHSKIRHACVAAGSTWRVLVHGLDDPGSPHRMYIGREIQLIVPWRTADWVAEVKELVTTLRAPTPHTFVRNRDASIIDPDVLLTKGLWLSHDVEWPAGGVS